MKDTVVLSSASVVIGFRLPRAFQLECTPITCWGASQHISSCYLILVSGHIYFDQCRWSQANATLPKLFTSGYFRVSRRAFSGNVSENKILPWIHHGNEIKNWPEGRGINLIWRIALLHWLKMCSIMQDTAWWGHSWLVAPALLEAAPITSWLF